MDDRYGVFRHGIRLRLVRMSLLSLSALLACMAATPGAALQVAQPARWIGLPLPASEVSLRKETYHYRMKGSVKLLFFWLGKDHVGGGVISRIGPAAAPADRWAEGIEVLFGSDPRRVPGGMNRWAYGRELAHWRRCGNGMMQLERTVFEGFMRKSPEQSLEEVRNHRDKASAGGGLAYEAIVSTVLADAAFSELYPFDSAEEADFRLPDPIGRRFQSLLRDGTASRNKELANTPRKWERPAGFLTAVQSLVDRVIRCPAPEKALDALHGAAMRYVYNARIYSLTVTGAKLHREFELEEGKRYKDVAEISFDTDFEDSGKPHSFSLCVPVRGPMAGIPLRAVDRPRWWLKVELILEDAA